MPHKKKEPTKLQKAIKSYTALRSAEKKVDVLREQNTRAVTGLSTDDCIAYEKATTNFENALAENAARIERLQRPTPPNDAAPTQEPQDMQNTQEVQNGNDTDTPAASE